MKFGGYGDNAVNRAELSCLELVISLEAESLGVRLWVPRGGVEVRRNNFRWKMRRAKSYSTVTRVFPFENELSGDWDLKLLVLLK